jgi:hypothetical protein
MGYGVDHLGAVQVDGVDLRQPVVAGAELRGVDLAAAVKAI